MLFTYKGRKSFACYYIDIFFLDVLKFIIFMRPNPPHSPHLPFIGSYLFTNASRKPSEGGSLGVPIVVQWKQIRPGTMRLQVWSLASLRGLRIQHCHELWCRMAATALIWPLAWEPPYASGVALKRPKNKNIKIKKEALWGLISSLRALRKPLG